MSESYAPMIIRHVRTFYRFDMSAFFVDYSTCPHSGKIGDYSTLWNPSRILKIKFDTLACNRSKVMKVEGLEGKMWIVIECRYERGQSFEDDC